MRAVLYDSFERRGSCGHYRQPFPAYNSGNARRVASNLESHLCHDPPGLGEKPFASEEASQFDRRKNVDIVYGSDLNDRYYGQTIISI